MSDLLKKIVALNDGAGLRAVSVPEWDTIVYFLPMTPADRVEIRRGIDPNDDMDLMVSTLQHMARDKAGNRVFDNTIIERAALMKSLDINVLIRVISSPGQREDEDDLKND